MLEDMLRGYRDSIRLRLNGRPPAKLKPLEISLCLNAVPSRASQRKYLTPEQIFMNQYVENLLRLRFLATVEYAELVSAPIIAPK